MSQVRQLPVDDISPNPRNPRKHFAESKLDELAESIDKQGLLQPVLVRPNGDGYELVHGERRLRAIKRIDGETIRAEVRDLSDREALEISVTENLQREDVSPLSEAEAYRLLIDEFDLTQQEAAERVGKSQSHIANQLKLLDLPERLQRDILHKIFTPWQAREIAKVWGEYYLSDFVIDHELSVQEIRNVINQLKDGDKWIFIYRDLSLDFFEDDLEQGPLTFEVEDEDRTISSAGDVQNFNIWADRNLEGWEYDREYAMGPNKGQRIADVRDPEPVVYSWIHRRVMSGFTIISMADHEGYEGKIQTKIAFPRRMFGWLPLVNTETGEVVS